LLSLSNDPFLLMSNSISNKKTKEWAESGKKVAGYYCTYVPEELLHAAGFLPFRIRSTGAKDTDLADVYMVRFTCSFVRASLNLALKGYYDFLDCFVVCNSCDHSRRMFELFDLKVFNRDDFKKDVKKYYISVPHVITNVGFDWYLGEIIAFKKRMEKDFKIKIEDNDLINAIQIYNKNREFLRKIHQYRLTKEPKLTGTDFLKIVMANASVPKNYANQELERVLEILKDSPGIGVQGKKRLMLVGSVIDNVEFVELIEKSGAMVISDFLCFGLRACSDDINFDDNESALTSIARRTYFRTSCPRMMNDHERRLQDLLNEIKNSKIDGVILQRINNCDLHGCDNMLYMHELKELGIPVLNIDREWYQSDYTRLQTRIEAFIEMLEK